MDKFTKVMLALIVCLLAIIAFKPQGTITTVHAAPAKPYTYQIVPLFKSPCTFTYENLNPVLTQGYEIIGVVNEGAWDEGGRGDCATHLAVLVRK